MSTTTAGYLAVTQNLTRYQAMTAAEPAVKTATAYYEANIGKVASVQDFVGNYRLLSYALDAYGLGDEINAKALITKVLEGGVSNPKSLANTLSDSRWKAFAPHLILLAGARHPSHRRARSRRQPRTMSSSSSKAIKAPKTSAFSSHCISSALRQRFPMNTGSWPIRISWRLRRRSSVCRRRRARPTSMHRRRLCRN
jgi:hypothetical protein